MPALARGALCPLPLADTACPGILSGRCEMTTSASSTHLGVSYSAMRACAASGARLAAATLAADVARAACAPSSDALESRRWKPVELDMSRPDAELHAVCAAALTSTLTPIVAVRNHGIEELCAAVARESARENAAVLETEAPSQVSFELTSSPSDELRGALCALSIRLLRVLIGEEAAAGAELDGRLCLRVYPRSPSGTEHQRTATAQRLGAHCDATLFTLLWSTAPGLQVLDPERAIGWTPRHVLEFGLPAMGSIDDEPPELREEHWATVELPWVEGVLLLSLGTGWQACERASAALPAQCAALHRVAISGLEEDRLSLPYLVDWATTSEEP